MQISFFLFSVLVTITYSMPCCIIHLDEGSCMAEAGTAQECVWLDDGSSLLTASTGIQCVSAKWVACETYGVCPPPPLYRPDPDCIFDTCTVNTVSYNIAFLIDESGSVGSTNYMTSLDFVENMVENDINSVSKISMIAFGSGTDRIYHFTDSQLNQKAGALAALDAERSDYNGGMTCTSCGLSMIIDDYAVGMFYRNSQQIEKYLMLCYIY